MTDPLCPSIGRITVDASLLQGFWNVGTQLGIFSGNGQRSLNSVMERSSGGDASPDAYSELNNSITTNDLQDENGDLSWEKWDQVCPATNIISVGQPLSSCLSSYEQIGYCCCIHDWHVQPLRSLLIERGSLKPDSHDFPKLFESNSFPIFFVESRIYGEGTPRA